MNAIHKFPVYIGQGNVFQTHKGATILDVQIQANDPRPNSAQVWVMVDTSQPLVDFGVSIFGTGHTLPPDLQPRHYVGTFQTAGGNLVWHAFGGQLADEGRRESYDAFHKA